VSKQNNPSDLLSHRTVSNVIRRTAGQLARRRDFATDDIEDIAGALRVLIAVRLQHFDPLRSGLHTFATRAARSAAASLVRERHREKRQGDIHTRSFEDLPLAPTGEHRCAESIAETDAARRRGTAVPDPIDALITRRSIDEIVATLHPDLVIVVRMLREDAPFAAAQRLGISRRRLRVLIAALRERFVSGGFVD